jgi:uncharacterized protein YtpQ (UPF0354 family)
MQIETLLQIASPTLERMAVQLVDYSQTEVTLEAGMGFSKRRFEATIEPLRHLLAQSSEAGRARVVSYFRGVGAVAAAPRPNRREANAEFAQAAGRILPSLEGSLFGLGAKAAGLELPIFAKPFVGDLHVIHFVELDNGRRLLTEQDTRRWGVTAERVEKAGLSNLYYRSAQETPQVVIGLEGARRFHIGDGYDAARALVLEPLFYDECKAGIAFAIPATDALIILDGPCQDADHVALGHKAQRDFRESAWALSEATFEQTGEIVQIQ